MKTTNLPVDAALPQLPFALDGAAMAEVLGGCIDPTWQVQACEVDRVKYRPGRNLSVSYRLTLVGGGCRPWVQPVSARFCTGGASAARHAKALKQPRQACTAGPDVGHLPALDCALHWWPNDAKLPAGRVLAQADRLRPGLAQVAQALWGRGAEVMDHAVTVVQLVPEHRLTARVDLLHRDGRRRRVYAKADAEHRGAQTQAWMHALWHQAPAGGAALALPEPLGWHPVTGLHWQDELPGRPLLHLDTGGGEGLPAPWHAQVGAQVAALHRSRCPAGRRQDLPALRLRLAEVVAMVSLLRPALRPQAERLAARLEDTLRRLAGETLVPLHGDLHPGNVLVHEGAIGLVDFDSAHHGLAALDLGAWQADALYRALLQGQPEGVAWGAAREFVVGYVVAGGQRLDPATLAWATAWQLLCQRVWRCLVNLKPGRWALVPALLDLACAIAEGRARSTCAIGMEGRP